MTVELFCSGALVLVVLVACCLRAMSVVPATLVIFLHAGVLFGSIEQPPSEILFHPGQVSHKIVSMTPEVAAIEIQNHSRLDLRRLTLDCAYVREGTLGRMESRPAGKLLPAGETARAEVSFDPPLPALDSIKDLSCLPRFIPITGAD